MIKDIKIIKIKDLLSNSNLTIPDYQRPYKWTTKNVNQLIDDILFFNDRNAYRLGSIIIHNENGKIEDNIVDGQQRTITFLLLALAIFKNRQNELDALKKIYSEKEINEFIPKISWNFSNSTSQFNLVLPIFRPY